MSNGRNSREYIKHQEQRYKDCLKRLYRAKGHKYYSPVYHTGYDWQTRTIETGYYKRSYRSKRSKKVKRYCNRQVRRYKKGISDGNCYRHLTEFWWELY